MTNSCTHYFNTTLTFFVWRVHSLRQGGEVCGCFWHQTLSLCWFPEGDFSNFHLIMILIDAFCQGDAFVRARTETVKAAVQTQEDFRPRCGPATKSNQSVPLSGVEPSQRPSGRRSSRQSGRQPSCHSLWPRVFPWSIHLHNHHHLRICDNLS